MKKCVDYTQQLSAYYDGELSDSEALRVKQHVDSCEECSALLEIYKEISVASDTSSLPVPDALRIGVMNRVRSDELYGSIKSKKNPGYIILTRYMPIAACLIVVFFVWSFWGDSFGLKDSAHPQNYSNSETAGGLATIAPAPDATCDSSLDGSSFSSDINAPDFLEENLDFPAELIRSVETPASLHRSQREAYEISEYISAASYWITIVGELPDYLSDLDPQPFGSWYGWDMVFEIPSEDVQKIESEVFGSFPSRKSIKNSTSPDGAYAVVLYANDND